VIRVNLNQLKGWTKGCGKLAISISILSLSIAISFDFPSGKLQSNRAAARPAEVFSPYLEQIRLAIPPSAEMRLPSQILLGGPGGLDPNALIVKVLPTNTPPRLTVSLFTCERGPFPCLVGSFTAEPAASANAQRELSRHQAMAAPITLTDGVRGYFIEGPNQMPRSDFSSLMWQQDGMIYTVSFLAAERQNILYMARQMAIAPPLKSLQI
jgi:hypothetical protein